MANFCKQCNEELFGVDASDFGPFEAVLKPGEGFLVLCEGCGPTLVDNNGVCINIYCLELHGQNVCRCENDFTDGTPICQACRKERKPCPA